MKISNIALSITALIGIAGVGGSYFTGKQAEQRYPEIIAQLNQKLKDQNPDLVQIQYKDVQFERHFFSSDAKYVLELTIDGVSYQLQGSDKIYHGPFPLNRLTKGNPLPVAASIESHLNLPDELKNTSKPLEPFFVGDATLSYTMNLSGDYRTQPIKNDTVEMGAVKFDYDGDLYGKGKGSVSLPSFKYTGDDAVFELENVHYQAHLVDNQGLHHLGPETVSLQADKFKMTNPTQHSSFAYQNIVLNGKNTLKGERYAGDVQFSGDLVVARAKEAFNLGKVNVNFAMDSDAKLTDKLTGYLSETGHLDSPQAVEILQKIAKKGLKLHFNPIKLTNEQGELELQLLLNSKPSENLNFNNLSEALALLQKSHFTLKVDTAAIEGLINQVAKIQGIEPQQAKQQAEQTVAVLKQQLSQTGTMVVNDKQITTDLTVDEGKVTLNGQLLSDAEVQNRLLMLIFSLGAF